MEIYELTYLISPDTAENEIESIGINIKSSIREKEGTISKSNLPIKKKLAYPVKKKAQAFLVNLTFSLSPEKVECLEKEIKEEKQIIRHLIFKKKIIEKTPIRRALPKLKTQTKPKTKVELKEIDKKLEEILND